MTEQDTRFFAKPRGIFTLAALLLAVFCLAVAVGSTSLSPTEFWDGLFLKEGAENISIILYYLRLPRAFAALLAGVGLSLSGVLLQSVTANKLAAPNIIGVNAGAGFCCILTLCFFPMAAAALPLAAFLGAFGTTLLIVSVAARLGGFRSTVILCGIAFTALLNAGISLLTLIDSDVLIAYNAFSIGGLGGVRIEQLWLPATIIAVCFCVSLILSGHIHLLCLGDALASSLGVRVRALRMICLICASASAAAAVSFAGLLGFVGLVVPHMARRLVGQRTIHVLTVSAFLGAILVLLADLVGRTLLAPTGIPVGILMAMLGAPFFLVLLLKRRGQNAIL